MVAVAKVLGFVMVLSV
jgi:hypothetical protein